MKKISALKQIVSEPISQFLMIGLLLFVCDIAINREQDPHHHIVIDDDRFQELIDIFIDGQGREPSASEINKMVVKWTQNEIIYREALKLGLDKGDEMIRSRLILKLHNILFNQSIPETPSEAELQAFFEVNRARYESPALYNIELVSVEPNATYAVGETPIEPDSDAQNRVLRYDKRSESNMVQLLGQDNWKKLVAAAQAQWVYLNTDGNAFLARINKTHPPQTASIDAVKQDLLKDWKQFSSEYKLAQQTVDIANKYTIELNLSELNKTKLNKQIDLQQPFEEMNTESKARLMKNSVLSQR